MKKFLNSKKCFRLISRYRKTSWNEEFIISCRGCLCSNATAVPVQVKGYLSRNPYVSVRRKVDSTDSTKSIRKRNGPTKKNYFRFLFNIAFIFRFYVHIFFCNYLNVIWDVIDVKVSSRSVNLELINLKKKCFELLKHVN